MQFLQKHTLQDVALNLMIAGLYILFAKIGLLFALKPTTITIFWPAGGFALAALLLSGSRCLPGIFIGGVVAALMTVNSPWIASVLGVADAMETYVAYWFVTRYFRINLALETRRDLLKLTLMAGVIASTISALIGTTALLIGNIIPASLYAQICLRWWMGDVLGIAFLTPLILIWRRPPQKLSSKLQALELLALLGSTTIMGLVIFFDWFQNLEYAPHGIAWVIMLIAWSGIRFGRHTTTVLQLIIFTLALWSASHHTGHYAHDMVQSGLFNFWLFGMVSAVGGLTVAVMSDEHKKTQDLLAKTSQYQRALLDNFPFAVWLKDTESHFLTVNDGFARTFGAANAEELTGRNDFDVAPQDLAASYRNDDIAVMASRQQKYVEEEVFTGGVRKWFETYKAPVLDTNGIVLGTVGFARDITKRKEIESALRASEERWKFALEGAGDGVWEYHFETGNNIISWHLKEILGFEATSSEFNNQLNDWAERLHPDSVPSTMQALQAVIDNKTDDYVVEQQVRCEDDSYKWLLTRGMVLSRNGDGKPVRMIGTSSDITVRKQTENALKQREHHLQAILDTTSDCVKLVSRDGTLLSMNSAGLALIEANTVDTVVQQSIYPLIAPEYRDAFQKFNEQVCDGMSGYIEFEIIGLNGTRRWMETHAVPFQSEQYAERVHLAFTQEITQRKQAEIDLRISAIAFESQEGVFVTDAKSIILRVNRAFTNITGYSNEEVIGQTPRIMASGLQDTAFYARMWQTIHDTGYWAGELWNRHKNGEIYPEHLTITAIKDHSGTVCNYVASMLDITDAKQREQQRLAHEIALRNTLVREVHHRIKNSLQGATGLLRQALVRHPELKDPVTDVISQIRSIAVIHGLQGANSHSQVMLQELVSEIAANNQHLWQTPLSVDIAADLALWQISEPDAVPLALVLNELVLNAIKHGDHNSVINLTLREDHVQNMVMVTITNSGQLSQDGNAPNMPVKGTGLTLTNLLLPENGASLSCQQSGNIVSVQLSLTSPVITLTTLKVGAHDRS